MPASAPDQKPSTGDDDLGDGLSDTLNSTLNDRLLAWIAAYPGALAYVDVIEHVTEAYLGLYDPLQPPRPRIVRRELLNLTNVVLLRDNESRTGADKSRMLKRLHPFQVAACLQRFHHVVNIMPSRNGTDREYDVLAVYMRQGRNTGVHSPSEEDIKAIARLYDPLMTISDGKEILSILKGGAPRVLLTRHRNLVAVNNGLFNYSRSEPLVLTLEGRTFTIEPKGLIPFDPAFVCLSKCHIDLDPNADNPRLFDHLEDGPDGWDVESWFRALQDDPEVVELLWQITGAVIRPNVSWNKTAWFFSTVGSNGKGTLCALQRNLIGEGAHTSIPLADFGKEFALEPLLHASAIIVDENPVGTFIDDAANLKSVVTNDVIQVNRKHRMPVAYQFWGFMVQCLNELPRSKDKSESFYRRQLYVPFEKSFTGVEKKWIKDDYLRRPEVLRYVLKRVLLDMDDYYRLSEPKACLDLLDEARENNNPTLAFWRAFREEFAWDLLPFTFLYDLFMVWFHRNYPSGIPVNNKVFITGLVEIVRTDTGWYCHDKDQQIRPKSAMDDPEPLIHEYDLTGWMDPLYRGLDPLKKCRPTIRTHYRGLQRYITPSAGSAAGPDEPDPTDAGNTAEAPGTSS